MTPISSDSIADLIRRRSAEQGAQAFLEDARSERSVSYHELATRAAGWSAELDAAGVAPEASVLLDIDDPIELAVAHLAVLASGRCSVPVDPAAPAGDLTRTLAAIEPSLVLTDRPERHAEHGRAVVATGSIPAAAAPLRSGGRVRLRTSGSTGAPKVVELTEPQLLHVARAVARHNELTPADRGYCPLPLFHVNAEVVGLLATLVAGGTLVLDRRFRRTGFWDLLREREITWVNAVPAIWSILALEPDPPRLPRLRLVRSASAALPPSVRVRIERMLLVPLVESYGMTEAASQITATPLYEPVRAGSAGRPVAAELQVRRPAGTLAPIGEIGRVWIRGPGIVTGYVDGRAADRFDEHGWLDTGDLAHVDADGFVYLAGRADDVINRGGEMVYPREIEEVLLADAQVRDVIVVGRPEAILGEVPVAYVLPRGDVDEAALIQRLQDRCVQELSRFKRPAAFHLVADLPRAATGKIRRHEVRALALHG